MHWFRKHKICIMITDEQLFGNGINSETKIKDIAYQGKRFNQKHFHLFGIDYDFYQGAYHLFICHPEFEAVPEASVCRRYYLEDARIKFPYLFADTDPILYRKFV